MLAISISLIENNWNRDSLENSVATHYGVTLISMRAVLLVLPQHWYSLTLTLDVNRPLCCIYIGEKAKEKATSFGMDTWISQLCVYIGVKAISLGNWVATHSGATSLLLSLQCNCSIKLTTYKILQLFNENMAEKTLLVMKRLTKGCSLELQVIIMQNKLYGKDFSVINSV